MDLTLNQLKKKAEEVVGAWTGDDSGTLEDMAHCANEILEKIAELEPLLEELNLK